MQFQGSTHVLGPFKRSVIWVQGCLKNCPGCIAPESHALTGQKISIDTILQWISQYPDNEGITISGGEPFLQAKALCQLVKEVRKQNKGVIIYSGYTYQELLDQKDPDISELLSLTDLLIDGPYIQKKDDGSAGRGSSNQQYIHLTQRYFNHQDYFQKQRQAVIYTDGRKFILEGIPSDEDKILFEAIAKGGRKSENK